MAAEKRKVVGKEMGYLLVQLLQVALDDNQFSILDKGSAMTDYILIREELNNYE